MEVRCQLEQTSLATTQQQLSRVHAIRDDRSKDESHR